MFTEQVGDSYHGHQVQVHVCPSWAKQVSTTLACGKSSMTESNIPCSANDGKRFRESKTSKTCLADCGPSKVITIDGGELVCADKCASTYFRERQTLFRGVEADVCVSACSALLFACELSDDTKKCVSDCEDCGTLRYLDSDKKCTKKKPYFARLGQNQLFALDKCTSTSVKLPNGQSAILRYVLDGEEGKECVAACPQSMYDPRGNCVSGCDTCLRELAG